MCDFKPGDEVVCVDARLQPRPDRLPCAPLARGATYTVSTVGLNPVNEVVVYLVGQPNPCPGGLDWGYWPYRFRKVQKRNDRLTIEAFLTIKPGQFEEPKRTKAPVKKGVDA